MKFLNVPQSGSIAASTHSHNRAGQYTRNRRSPVQPIGSGRRAVVRARFGAASGAWGALTNAQRASWESFTLDHPVTDSLGQSIILTGHAMFVRVYASAANAELPLPTGAIAVLALPTVTPMTFAFSVATGIAIGVPGDLIDSAYTFAFSRPMGPGRSFNKTFWQPLGSAGIGGGDATTYSLTTALYAAEFGAPVVGRRVFTRVTPVSKDGWNGTPVIASALVVA